MFDLAARDWSDRVLEICGLDRVRSFPTVVEPGTVVGAVTARGGGGDRPARGHAGRRRRRRHAARPARHRRRRAGPLHGRRRQLLAAARSSLDEPLIDPQARLRTLCHAVPGRWMMEGIGFYCGIVMRWFRDAFCELEQARGGARGRRRLRRLERRRPRVPPGSNGVFGDLLERHAGQAAGCTPRRRSSASTSTTRRAPGRAECFRAIEESAAYVVARPPAASSRSSTGVDGRRGRASPAARPRARSGRRSSPTCSACRCTSRRQGVDRARRRDLRRRRRRPLRRRRRGGGAARPLRAHRRARRRRRRAPTTSSTSAGSSSTAGRSSSPKPGSCARCGARPGPDRTKGRSTMPEADSSETTRTSTRTSRAPDQGFFLKGSGAYDWGMKNRLARIFRPDSGRTVMLADRPRLLPGPDDRPRAGRPQHRAARAVRRRADAHARHPALDDPRRRTAAASSCAPAAARASSRSSRTSRSPSTSRTPRG